MLCGWLANSVLCIGSLNNCTKIIFELVMTEQIKNILRILKMAENFWIKICLSMMKIISKNIGIKKKSDTKSVFNPNKINKK